MTTPSMAVSMTPGARKSRAAAMAESAIAAASRTTAISRADL